MSDYLVLGNRALLDPLLWTFLSVLQSLITNPGVYRNRHGVIEQCPGRPKHREAH